MPLFWKMNKCQKSFNKTKNSQQRAHKVSSEKNYLKIHQLSNKWNADRCKNHPVRFFVNNSLLILQTFHFREFTFTHSLAISQNFRPWEVCRECLKFVADVIFFVPNIWMAHISEPLDRFGWITPHWKAIMLFFSNVKRVTTFHVILCWRQHFLSISWKISHVTLSNAKLPYFMFWYTFWPPMGYQYTDLSQS